MKKNKFILAAAFAAALVSCSQDENLNSSNDYTELLNSGQIAFATTNASKADTRAGETLTALSNFYVTAVNQSNTYYFKEQQFNKEGSVFTSATKFYWPTTGTLSFYAVNYKGTISSATAVPTYTYTEWDGSKDLVAATVKASEKQIPCPLTFKHLTAKVGYKAMAKDQTEELSYSLYAVRMTTPAKGSYTFANASQGIGTWSIDNNTTKTYDYGVPASGVTFNQTGSNASGNTTFNVLPVTDGNITFEVEYKVLKNGNVISDFTGENKKTVTVTNPNLTPGKKYVYNFLLTRGTDETITFTTTVAEWETGDTKEVVVTPKITEISCLSPWDMIPFAEGWENKDCPAEVSENDFYVSLIFKGENLTEDWVRQSINGVYINGGSENENYDLDVYSVEEDYIEADITLTYGFGEGDRIQFNINGVKSGWMSMYKAN